jgi:phage gpG-like protein
MANVAVRLDAADLAKLSKRISDLLHDTLDLTSVMEDAAQYMKRSTVNRILRSKTSPEGERWEALSDVTIALKGHDRSLFASGELAAGIYVEEITPDGFVIAADSDHASYMQNGVAVVKGAFKSKRPMPQIPARPFMGFSDENVRRISKMIRDHLAEDT